jgi:adenosylcobinamide kinase / adenosylcobinamide-phosphate guanylyltransferase
VILMGMRTLSAICRRLVADGIGPETSASCVADVSLPTQRVVRSTLGQLAVAVSEAGLGNPAVVVVDAGRSPAPRQRILVLGGNRSGKSRFAEAMLEHEPAVDYIATSAPVDDAEWDERVRRHQLRRSPAWATVETLDLATELGRESPPAMIDSITAWLARVMDECECWDDVLPATAAKELDRRVDQLCDEWSSTARTVVAVSDEVGSGIVAATVSGRRFADTLGALNQRLAAAADEVHLVTAGIARRLK